MRGHVRGRGGARGGAGSRSCPAEKPVVIGTTQRSRRPVPARGRAERSWSCEPSPRALRAAAQPCGDPGRRPEKGGAAGGAPGRGPGEPNAPRRRAWRDRHRPRRDVASADAVHRAAAARDDHAPRGARMGRGSRSLVGRNATVAASAPRDAAVPPRPLRGAGERQLIGLRARSIRRAPAGKPGPRSRESQGHARERGHATSSNAWRHRDELRRRLSKIFQTSAGSAGGNRRRRAGDEEQQQPAAASRRGSSDGPASVRAVIDDTIPQVHVAASRASSTLERWWSDSVSGERPSRRAEGVDVVEPLPMNDALEANVRRVETARVYGSMRVRGACALTTSGRPRQDKAHARLQMPYPVTRSSPGAGGVSKRPVRGVRHHAANLAKNRRQLSTVRRDHVLPRASAAVSPTSPNGLPCRAERIRSRVAALALGPSTISRRVPAAGRWKRKNFSRRREGTSRERTTHCASAKGGTPGTDPCASAKSYSRKWRFPSRLPRRHLDASKRARATARRASAQRHRGGVAGCRARNQCAADRGVTSRWRASGHTTASCSGERRIWRDGQRCIAPPSRYVIAHARAPAPRWRARSRRGRQGGCERPPPSANSLEDAAHSTARSSAGALVDEVEPTCARRCPRRLVPGARSALWHAHRDRAPAFGCELAARSPRPRGGNGRAWRVHEAVRPPGTAQILWTTLIASKTRRNHPRGSAGCRWYADEPARRPAPAPRSAPGARWRRPTPRAAARSR